MNFPRASGILLHPTSLPGEYGIGDLGKRSFEFVDFLVRAKQTYWQMLPLGPTGWGDSPYSSFSAFAGNTLLISPEKLVEAGLLAEDWHHPADEASAPFLRQGGESKNLPPRPRNADTPPIQEGSLDTHLHPSSIILHPSKVNYGAVYERKTGMLRAAFENFQNTGDELRTEFETFVHENASWLDDYALYRAIKASQYQKAWYEWDAPLKLRDAKALSQAAKTLRDAILAEKVYQFLFFRQWYAVKKYANAKGIKIVGDVPIFVARDSADVWRHQELFKLNADGTPKFVSGVPPDYFSKTGQLWGNPIYDWDSMRSYGFQWWIDRIRSALNTVDVVRIDHFLGFAAAWEVPGDDPTAEHGAWVDAPGSELFTALKKAVGDLPFWVEDLGVVTPALEALRDNFGFPGMRILQFAFGGDPNDHALPHNYIRNCIAYTGTHDNDTTLGWWNSLAADSNVREFCVKYLNTGGSEINWDLIRAAWASVADTAVAPLQDILGLGGNARMNFPSTTEGNWQWRYKDGDLTDKIADRLRELTEIYRR